jgi:hypothetical protein
MPGLAVATQSAALFGKGNRRGCTAGGVEIIVHGKDLLAVGRARKDDLGSIGGPKLVGWVECSETHHERQTQAASRGVRLSRR